MTQDKPLRAGTPAASATRADVRGSGWTRRPSSQAGTCSQARPALVQSRMPSAARSAPRFAC